MNEEQQRIAIGLHLGWKTYPSERPSHFGHLLAIDPEGKDAFMPNYPACLNAMHEAEKIIIHAPETIVGDAGRKRYRNELRKASGRLNLEHLPAAQRAEAFLKTLGLWKEGA